MMELQLVNLSFTQLSSLISFFALRARVLFPFDVVFRLTF